LPCRGRWKAAIIAIVVAAVLDTLDGRTARLRTRRANSVRSWTDLSDIVSFGVGTGFDALSLDAARRRQPWLAGDAGLWYLRRLALGAFQYGAERDRAQEPKAPYFVGSDAAGAGLAIAPMIGESGERRTAVR